MVQTEREVLTAAEYSAARVKRSGTQLEPAVQACSSCLSAVSRSLMLLLSQESSAVLGMMATHSPH